MKHPTNRGWPTRTVSPLWAPLLLFELLGALTAIVFSFYLLFAFWTKRRSFPLSYVLLAAYWIAFMLINDRLQGLLPIEDTTSPAETARDWVQAAVSLVWVSYILRSRRVRSTFLPPPEED